MKKFNLRIAILTGKCNKKGGQKLMLKTPIAGGLKGKNCPLPSVKSLISLLSYGFGLIFDALTPLAMELVDIPN